jgi:dUTP pyrophosphatase
VDKVRGFESCVIPDSETTIIAKTPERATKGSAGYDFFAAEDVTIPSIWKSVYKYMDDWIRIKFSSREKYNGLGKVSPTIVKTYIKAYMLEDEVLYLYSRSSFPIKHGLIIPNSVGIIDSDYYNNRNNEGNIGFMFYNLFPYDIVIHRGEKIGQGIFAKFLRADNDNSENKEREGGFGSTDRESVKGGVT